MSSAYDTGTRPISGTILAQKAPHELLIVLGGALAVLLSVVAFVIRWMEGVPLGELNTILRTFVLTVVLGGVLVAAGAIVRKNLMNGAIMAVVIAIILIVYGGQEGTIGGVVGLIGAGLAAASPYMHRKT